MSENFRIKNLDSFEKALKQSPVIAEKIIKDALKESVISWQGASASRTPVDTGRLRQNVVSLASVTVDKTRAIISPNVDYAVYVHEGTGRMSKRPFFKWGLDQSESKIERIFKKAGNKLMDVIATRSNLGI